MVPTCPDVCLVWAVMFGHIWKFRKCQIFRTWQQKNPKTWTPLKAPLYLFRYSGLKWSFGCLTYKSWIRAGRSSLRQNKSWTSLSTSWAQAALNQYALIHSIDQNQFVCHQTFVLTYQVFSAQLTRSNVHLADISCGMEKEHNRCSIPVWACMYSVSC